MADRNFFGSNFLERLPNSIRADGTLVTYRLEEKINEHYNQAEKDDFETIGAPSYAWGLFSCRNVQDSSQKLLMKVYMQIPFKGSEFEPVTERAKQATEEPCQYAQAELTAFRRIEKAGCKSTPRLLDMKVERQEQTDLVPGGYLAWLVTTWVPGIRLGPNVVRASKFWSFPEYKRSKIRMAFKAAFLELQSAGVDIDLAGPKNLVWDDASEKIYIVDFRLGSSPEETGWRNAIWADWLLALPPDGAEWYDSDYDDEDIEAAGWRL